MKYGGLTRGRGAEDDHAQRRRSSSASTSGIGSIEVGKDADLAIFNGHPLNGYARVRDDAGRGRGLLPASDEAGRRSPPPRPAPAKPAERRSSRCPSAASGRTCSSDATVHPVSGPAIDKATVVIEQGQDRRTSARAATTSTPRRRRSIDATGLHLYPGMIDAGTVLGLTEIGSAARDAATSREGGDFQPDLRASIGINPDSELIPVTRANGVTDGRDAADRVASIAGQAALINLAGWVPRRWPSSTRWRCTSSSRPSARCSAATRRLAGVGRAVARKQREEKLRKLKDLFAAGAALRRGAQGEPGRAGQPAAGGAGALRPRREAGHHPGRAARRTSSRR